MSNRDLSGMKVLLIATSFFGYEQRIRQQMIELGANVVYYDERCVSKSYEKALIKISPKLFLRKMNSYYASMIDNNHIDFDFVFIYGATMMEPKHLEMLRNAYKTATFTLYLADSVIDNKRVESLFCFFNRVFTFDYGDWLHYKKTCSVMQFLPLFYSPEYENKTGETPKNKIDLSFIGTIHSDRLGFLEKIKEQAEGAGFSTFFYYYLPSRFMFYFYWCTKKEFRKKHFHDFEYKKLSSAEIRNIILNSSTVIDIQYPRNMGLTIRTIETLGMKRKIITANGSIKKYDFYDANNVLIVDRRNPVLQNDFMKQEYREIDENIYKKYSLRNWILHQMCFSPKDAGSFTNDKVLGSYEV